jgi:hypothetical protein
MADKSPRPPTRPEHSEAYWNAMKYIILALTGLMVLALVLAVVVALRGLPWS